MSFYICTVIDSFCFSQPNGITYGYATFDLLLQNSSITKQKSIGSFIVTLMNSPITKRCFVIPNRREESLVHGLEIPRRYISC